MNFDGQIHVLLSHTAEAMRNLGGSSRKDSAEGFMNRSEDQELELGLAIGQNPKIRESSMEGVRKGSRKRFMANLAFGEHRPICSMA